MSLIDSIKEKLHSQPWYVWAGAAVAGGVVIVYIVRSKMNASKTASSGQSSPVSADQVAMGQLAADGYDISSLAGLPYAYGYTTSGPVVDNYPATTPDGSTTTTGTTPPPPTTPPPVTNPPTTTPPPTNTTHAPGSTFLGPTGVKHYETTGTQSLAQIAAKFGLKSWNDIYAIPDNQKLLGKMSATTAKSYIPKADLPLTLPGSVNIGTTGTGSGGMASEWESGMNPHRSTVHQLARGLSPSYLGQVEVQ